jgi:hypothetical protein
MNYVVSGDVVKPLLLLCSLTYRCGLGIEVVELDG